MATAPAPVGAQPEHLVRLMKIASAGGNLTDFLEDQQLATLGSDVVQDYERDKSSRGEWEEIVKEALKSAAQEAKPEAKDYPFSRASNVKYPILTIAATEFNARAYPAIVKGDETVQVKVVGSDKGRPEMMQTPQGLVPVPQMQPAVDPETGQPVLDPQSGEPVFEPAMGPDGKPAVVWAVPPGFKSKRAQRVKEYMNVVLNYRMENWEGDTDALLYQLSIVGSGFRKQWWDNRRGKPCTTYVPSLRLIAPMDAADMDTVPRLTEEIPEVYPYQIRQRMKTGDYRTVDLPPISDDDQAPRMLLECHCRYDMDGDGFDEPYVVTVDKETQEVLSVVAAFDAAGVELDGDDVVEITKTAFYTKYDFLPHPEGKFYGIGLGHLLNQLGDVINTTINMMIDAGHAQIAGGGFISSGLRLQGNGQTNTLRWRPGEYKVVPAGGAALRDAIWERTFPNPSPIMFNLLDLILGAAKDVAAIKDVTSGDASNNGQVGTTLALIEQGLQVFTAIYKRIYRALKSEFKTLYENLGAFGGEKTAADYAEVLDDVEADFMTDFNLKDMDIRPVSDPNSVTRLQKLARAQFLQQTGTNHPNVDQRELILRVYEAADVEDIEKLVPPPQPQHPDPKIVAEVNKVGSEISKNEAQAELYAAQTELVRAQIPQKAAETEKTQAQTAEIGANVGIKLGEAEDGDADGDNGRRLSEMA